jgi:hypothetical protein
METEPVNASNRSSYQSEQPIRRSLRSQNHFQQRIATSCKYL